MAKKVTPDFFNRPQVKKILWWSLIGLCIISFLSETILHRHGHFGDHSIDSSFGFYCFLGAVSVAVLVVLGKVLGSIIQVEEK